MRCDDNTAFASVLICGAAFLLARPITAAFGSSHHEPAVHSQCTCRASVTTTAVVERG